MPGFRKVCHSMKMALVQSMGFESFYKIVEDFIPLRQACKNEQYVQITGDIDVLVDDV